MTKRNDRTLWLNPVMDDYDGSDPRPSEILVPSEPPLPGLESVKPNVVSSRLHEGKSPTGHMHSPVLDLDFEVSLVPSSTEGHYHLFLDGLTMPWSQYADFLKSMASYGVIEDGYYRASHRRGMSCVRLPHIRKGS